MLLGRVCMKRFACWGGHQIREKSFYGSPCGAVSVSVVRGVSNYYCCAEGSRRRETTALAFHVVCPQPPTARLCQPGAPQRCPSAQPHAPRLDRFTKMIFSTHEAVTGIPGLEYKTLMLSLNNSRYKSAQFLILPMSCCCPANYM